MLLTVCPQSIRVPVSRAEPLYIPVTASLLTVDEKWTEGLFTERARTCMQTAPHTTYNTHHLHRAHSARPQPSKTTFTLVCNATQQAVAHSQAQQRHQLQAPPAHTNMLQPPQRSGWSLGPLASPHAYGLSGPHGRLHVDHMAQYHTCRHTPPPQTPPGLMVTTERTD